MLLGEEDRGFRKISRSRPQPSVLIPQPRKLLALVAAQPARTLPSRRLLLLEPSAATLRPRSPGPGPTAAGAYRPAEPDGSPRGGTPPDSAASFSAPAPRFPRLMLPRGTDRYTVSGIQHPATAASSPSSLSSSASSARPPAHGSALCLSRRDPHATEPAEGAPLGLDRPSLGAPPWSVGMRFHSRQLT